MSNSNVLSPILFKMKFSILSLKNFTKDNFKRKNLKKELDRQSGKNDLNYFLTTRHLLINKEKCKICAYTKF